MTRNCGLLSQMIISLIATFLFVKTAQAGGNDQVSALGHASRLQGTRAENWLRAQIRKFRSYPRLDRAYRLTSSGRLAEARRELEQCLTLDPGDLRARTAYLTLLFRLNDHYEVLRQADIVLKGQPGLASALLTRGQARESLGQFDEALRDFQAVASNARASQENRLFAANAVANLALARGKHEVALAALEQVAMSRQDYDLHLRRGLALESLGRVAEADAAYRSALHYALQPAERLTALNAAARVAGKRGDWVSAQKSLSAALKLDPRNPQQMRLLAEVTYNAKDYAQATDWTRKALSLQPNPKDREFLAGLLIARKDYPGAIEQYNQLLAESVSRDLRHRTYMNLGYAYGNLGQPRHAVEAFRKATEIRSDRTVVTALAQALERSGRTTDAIRTLETAVERYPTPDTHIKLGNLYAQMGDDKAAIRHLEQAVRATGAAELDFKLGMLYIKAGDNANALYHLNQAIKGELPSELRRAAFDQQGYLYSQLGQHHQAVDAFRKAAEIRSDAAVVAALAQAQEQSGRTTDAIQTLRTALERYPTPETHFKLGMLYVKTADNANALHHLNQALQGDLPSELRRTAFHQVGYIYGQMGQHQAAADSFRRAIEPGLDGPLIRQELGFALFRMERWEGALKQFLFAIDRQPTPMTMLQVARCYHRLEQPGMAVHYLRLAQDAADPLDHPLNKQLDDELGYLYAEQSDYAGAAEAWGRSLALEQDPAIAVRLGRVQQLQGRVEEAEKTLHSLAAKDLPVDLRVMLSDELAEVYDKRHEVNKAIEVLSEANRLQPTAHRHYRLGLYYLDLRRADRAIPQFEAAVARDPETSSYSESLAYAYKTTGRYREATRLFETVLKHHPERVALYQDLAYSYRQNANNEQAARWFRRAIDVRGGAAAGSLEEQQKVDQDLYRMRKEVASLSQRYDFTFYQSYRANGAATNASPFYPGGGVIPSQGGAEFLYQPPGIGFRDGRIFQVFGRMLWSNRPGSLAMDRESLQGGIGVRYKPLKSQNLFLSLERTVKVGARSLNNWLLGGAYTWGTGYDLKPGERRWNYTQFYSDVGYLAQKTGTWASYVEGRQGLTVNLADKLLLTPHATLNGRHQSPDPFRVSYFQGGPGLSLKYLFKGPRYDLPRSSLEFLVQYERGISTHSSHGWVFTTVWRFSKGRLK